MTDTPIEQEALLEVATETVKAVEAATEIDEAPTTKQLVQEAVETAIKNTRAKKAKKVQEAVEAAQAQPEPVAPTPASPAGQFIHSYYNHTPQQYVRNMDLSNVDNIPLKQIFEEMLGVNRRTY